MKGDSPKKKKRGRPKKIDDNQIFRNENNDQDIQP